LQHLDGEDHAMAHNLSRISTRLFLAAAGFSFLGSVYCWFLIDRDVGLFIGLWVPSILSLGCLLQLHLRRRKP
jgi:hypothetical protein